MSGYCSILRLHDALSCMFTSCTRSCTVVLTCVPTRFAQDVYKAMQPQIAHLHSKPFNFLRFSVFLHSVLCDGCGITEFTGGADRHLAGKSRLQWAPN